MRYFLRIRQGVRTPLSVNIAIPAVFCSNTKVMKSSIHPQNYRPVVFSDDQAGFAFLTQSTAQTTDTIKWEDGNTYPLVKVHISSASHPFFTGEEKIIDTEGRVDRFKARQAAAEARRAALANKAKKANANKATKADSPKSDKKAKKSSK